MRAGAWIALTACGVVALDQAVKLVTSGAERVLVPGVLALTAVMNEGMAFSFLSGVPFAAYLISPLALLFSALALRGQLNTRVRALAAGMALGGAVSNYADRLALGGVRDMFRLLFMRFAVFNVADAAITVGVIILAVCLLSSDMRRHAKEKNDE